MEKKTIVRLVITGLVVILASVFICGLTGSGPMTYQVPGPYTAESTNNFSTVQVEMTIQDEKIVDCAIASSGESDLLNDSIRAEWAQSIVDNQTAENDVISGATLVYSAASVQEAANDILVQAGLREASAEPEAEAEPEGDADAEPAAEAAALNDGTYTVQKTTDFSTIDVEITVENGAITTATVASEGANDLLTDEHRSAWADQIVENQAVDAVSGVTVSSNAVQEALAELLAQASGEAPAEAASATEGDEADDPRLASILPAIVTTMGDNRDNSYVTDYLEQDPYLVNIYEGYGFAIDYGSARGHEYTLEDVAKTQRPHAKANCLTCKTPDMHKMIEEQGVAVYSMPFDEVMAQMTQNVGCYTCHGADDGNGGEIVITHRYVTEALAGNAEAIKPATLSCGQCHIEYYFTPQDSEAMMPYHSVEQMTPEAILAYYDNFNFADWTQESTGTRLLKAQHPEMETFLQGKHAAFLSCADCHMPTETTEDGAEYLSHKLVSPLESEALLESCATCHGDADMTAFVHGIQERVTARETEVGNKLSAMKDKLAEAVASGTWSEEDLNAVRKLHREAQWFFDFCYVENSEGAHNSELAMRCLDTAEQKIDEALALLGETVEAPTSAEAEERTGSLTDGIYTAEATNDFSTVDVYVAVRNGLIDDCVISSSGDSDLLTDELRAEWAKAIVESQSADTDAISGASLTFSAASVKDAVDDILARAGASEAETEAEERTGSLTDGIYTAEATNDFSTVDVYVAVRNGLIDDCVISSSGDSDLLTDELRAEWARAIVDSQSADTDAISGASLTFSAASVKDAVDDILARADASEAEAEERTGSLTDGIYTAEAVNDFSTVDVYVAVRNGLIDDCVISSSGDNDLLTDELRAEWAQAIVDSQSADTDAISGASLTFSATSVKDAVDDILARAGGTETETEAEAEEAEADPIMRYMRPRPTSAEPAADAESAEEPAEAPAEAEAEADPIMRYMRPRP